jgi:hypothetical protein
MSKKLLLFLLTNMYDSSSIHNDVNDGKRMTFTAASKREPVQPHLMHPQDWSYQQSLKPTPLLFFKWMAAPDPSTRLLDLEDQSVLCFLRSHTYEFIIKMPHPP